MKEKILKHLLSSGEAVSPNQGSRQRNNCLQGLNEDKGFFSKCILVTRQAKRVRRETIQCHTVSRAKTFNSRLQYFVIECRCVGFSCLAKF